MPEVETPRRLAWILLTLTTLLGYVTCYPDGASPSACGHLTPGHGTPQQNPSPYTIEVPTNTYTAGAIIPVTIQGPPYAGFILQAQIVSTRTVVGKWADAPLNTKIMKCSRARDTMTHSSTMAKHNAIYRWIAPDYDVHLVEFIATVAPSKETWWRNIKSSAMTFDPRSITPALPSFPPSIVPYTQDYDLAFPFQTRGPKIVLSNDRRDNYNELDIHPPTPTDPVVPAKLPIIKLPDTQRDGQNIPVPPHVPPVHDTTDEPAVLLIPEEPQLPVIDIPSTTAQVPSAYQNSLEVEGPPYKAASVGQSEEDSEEPHASTAAPSQVSIESLGGVTDTIMDDTSEKKANVDEITRDEGAEFPSRINTDGSQYRHKRRRPFRRPRPPPEPWLGPGPDGNAFFHPWQRFSGWHGPRYLHWQSGAIQGYQSWRFRPNGRSTVDLPGVYEYRYYYK